mmetsp:Transcript_133809/g.232137  ORF Transcript_133809/g.232137 Transcript_133809/m.232137 type:complete len:139 (+) Transcript_133809:2714-3130(+)
MPLVVGTGGTIPSNTRGVRSLHSPANGPQSLCMECPEWTGARTPSSTATTFPTIRAPTTCTCPPSHRPTRCSTLNISTEMRKHLRIKGYSLAVSTLPIITCKYQSTLALVRPHLFLIPCGDLGFDVGAAKFFDTKHCA